MDEEKKKQVAIFRFGVISDFVSPARLDWGERTRLLREKCAREWQIPFSGRTRLSPATILSWIRAYERAGRRLEALYPRSRSDRGSGRALDEETVLALIGLRREMPYATVRSLIRVAQERRLVDCEQHLAESTVWRLLKRQGFMRREHAPVDRRRFEAELPNDIWQSDVMHGPSVRMEGKNRKAYLIAFIDDMSRLICHAQFYLSENLDCYLDCLRQALLTRGLPRKLYVDNGPAFRSLHLKQICASLGIALVHSKPYQPQGRGKVERFFRTVRSDFLAGFRGESLRDLNEALDAWVRNVYHIREHRSTQETPLRRFAAYSECLRAPPKDFQDHFRKQARRRVAKDRTVALAGRLYKAPVALIGKQITLLYHPQDLARLEVFAKLRTLCQFEGDSKPRLPLILAGQNSLLDLLQYRSSLPLSSRIVARSHLEGIDLDQMQHYLAHHLAIAGVKTQLFSAQAITAIQQGSAGLLRKANHLARGALIAAANEKCEQVSAEHVRLAATELV